MSARRSVRGALSSLSGPEPKEIRTPRQPVICDRRNLELIGGRELPLLAGCREAGSVPNVEEGPALLRAGTLRWDPVVDDPCLAARVIEDPDARPYIWDLEE